MPEEYDAVLDRARRLGEERHPGAPAAHHAAFANSVAYAVTGWSGGYGGPSMREHWCSRLVAPHRGLEGLTFDRAVEICEQACYGPLTRDIARMLAEEEGRCFDDAPGEQEEAERLLSARDN